MGIAMVETHPLMITINPQLMAKHALNSFTPRSNLRKMPTNITNIAIIPAGNVAGASVFSSLMGAFALRLAATLGSIGATLHLNSERFDRIHGLGESRKVGQYFFAEKASQWFTEQEEEYKYLLLEADTKDSAWTK